MSFCLCLRGFLGMMCAEPPVLNRMPLAVHHTHTTRLWMLSCSREHCRQTVLVDDLLDLCSVHCYRPYQVDCFHRMECVTDPFSQVRLFPQKGILSSSMGGVCLVTNILSQAGRSVSPKPRPKTQQRFTCQAPNYYKSAHPPQICKDF